MSWSLGPGSLFLRPGPCGAASSLLRLPPSGPQVRTVSVPAPQEPGRTIEMPAAERRQDFRLHPKCTSNPGPSPRCHLRLRSAAEGPLQVQ